jgi:hypothetical protein
MEKMFLSFDNLELRYEPFPIGIAKPAMHEGTYKELLSNFPPIDIFEDYAYLGKPGNKFVLSEKENPRVYNDFIKSNAVWRQFHGWIKSDAFVYGVMDMLRDHYIDLDYKYVAPMKRFAGRLKDLTRGKLCGRLPPLKARFEFSALPADGGNLTPHTDAPTKIVTLIVSMVEEGEWKPDFGGGTDVNRPKDKRFCFNQLNKLAAFDDMEVIDTYDFGPNQLVLFVKTFNSWHSVRPMTGTGSKQLRKTLTINIEPVV